MKKYNLTPEGAVEAEDGQFVELSEYSQLEDEHVKLIGIVDELHKLHQILLSAEEACRQKAGFFKEINCKREMRHWSKKAMLLARLTSELNSISQGRNSYKHFGEDTFLNDED